MQVSGKLLVLTTIGISVLMAGGSWWYNYSQSRRAAQFWGRDAAALLVASDKVELLELAHLPPAAGDEGSTEGAVAKTVDLTGKPGLVHLRHALTYDANFEWDLCVHYGPKAGPGWKYALRFTKGDRELVVLFPDDFTCLGRRLESGTLDLVPCPQLGPVMLKYLSKENVGALPPAPAN